MIKVNCNICGKNLKGFKFNDKYTTVLITRNRFIRTSAKDEFYLCDKCAKRLIKNLKGVTEDLLTAYDEAYEEEPKTPNEMRKEHGLRAITESERGNIITSKE